MLSAQSILIIVLSYILWRRFNRPKSPLDLINGPPGSSWFRGNFPELMATVGWEKHNEDALNTYGGIFKAYFYFFPVLYVSDPKSLHHILVKDAESFSKSVDSVNFSALSFGPGLLSVKGAEHRRQRKVLNPMFNIAHLREMTPIFYKVAHQLRETLAKEVSDVGSKEIDIVPWATRGALELAGQGIFGHSFEALETDTMGAYAYALKNILPVWMKLTLPRLVATRMRWMMSFGNPSLRRKIVDFVPSKVLHTYRDMADLLHHTSQDVFQARKRALSEIGGMTPLDAKGREILTAILKANDTLPQDEQMSDEEIIGQISTFTFAGMDSTSNGLTMILDLLSQHSDAQERLRNELREAMKYAGDLNYDALNALPYLDAIIRETLRLHPPSPNIVRTCTEDAIVPLSKPIYQTTGNRTNEVNPDIWGPDALEWKPERWLSPLPDTVREAGISGVYSNLMTFGSGNRACIGFKFAELELKTMLAVLVSTFKFEEGDIPAAWEMHGTIHPIIRNGEPSQKIKHELPIGLRLRLSLAD